MIIRIFSVRMKLMRNCKKSLRRRHIVDLSLITLILTYVSPEGHEFVLEIKVTRDSIDYIQVLFYIMEKDISLSITFYVDLYLKSGISILFIESISILCNLKIALSFF